MQELKISLYFKKKNKIQIEVFAHETFFKMLPIDFNLKFKVF